MTLKEAVEILREAEHLGHSSWYFNPLYGIAFEPPRVDGGERVIISESEAIAVAEKYRRESRARIDAALDRLRARGMTNEEIEGLLT